MSWPFSSQKKNSTYDFEREVKKWLETFSPKQTVYFAGLCAIRALPFLCAKHKDFSFWKDSEKQKHLYAIFNAIDAATLKYQNNYGFVYTIYAADAVRAAADAVARTDAVAVSAAYAVRAAAYAVRADDIRTVSFSVSAADAVARAAAYGSDKQYLLESILLNDLELIKTNKHHLLNNDVDGVYDWVWRNFQQALSATGCGYWAKLYADLFANRFIVDEKELERRRNVPNEIKAQGAATVARFLEDLKTQGAKRFNEARIVVIGEKGAGKTSLAKKLLNINAQMPKGDASTEGVDVTLWQLPEKLGDNGVNAHIWDFAGHVITHAAHRFFLSERCIYIIVYDGRTEMRNRLEYWLDHAKNYGGDSPVYIIVNKRDNHPPKINENTLRNKYPAIKDIKRFSIQDDLTDLKTFKNGNCSVV